jgi:uncharacterized radical SAM superfamily Fe-S cluster-containing enzyme
MVKLTPNADQGIIERQISRIRQFGQLSQCFDRRKAPDGLTFQRLLRGLEGWEDKSRGRSEGWTRRGFNGMFVAGMHFMDAHSYNLRRVKRCIIQYVATDGQLIPFCSYNTGVRSLAEKLIQAEDDPSHQPSPGEHPIRGGESERSTQAD